MMGGGEVMTGSCEVRERARMTPPHRCLFGRPRLSTTFSPFSPSTSGLNLLSLVLQRSSLILYPSGILLRLLNPSRD